MSNRMLPQGVFSTKKRSTLVSKENLPTELEQVLRNKRLRRRFKDFLMDKLAIESYLFYESCELYTKIKKQQWRTKAGTNLLNKFVLEGSQYEVNLSGKVRNKLLATQEFNSDTFEEAKSEIFTLMKTNFLEQFCKYLSGENELDKKRVSMKPEQLYKKSPDFNPVDSPPPSPQAFERVRKMSSARRLSIWQSWAADEDEEDVELLNLV